MGAEFEPRQQRPDRRLERRTLHARSLAHRIGHRLPPLFAAIEIVEETGIGARLDARRIGEIVGPQACGALERRAALLLAALGVRQFAEGGRQARRKARRGGAGNRVRLLERAGGGIEIAEARSQTRQLDEQLRRRTGARVRQRRLERGTRLPVVTHVHERSAVLEQQRGNAVGEATLPRHGERLAHALARLGQAAGQAVVDGDELQTEHLEVPVSSLRTTRNAPSTKRRPSSGGLPNSINTAPALARL